MLFRSVSQSRYQPPPLLAPRPQDYIIPQEDVIKYRETEYNVFITSSDRNWMLNNTENRYNFSVIFNTGNTTGALGYNSAVQQRFRNIQRIEFVKAIVPIESLTALVRVPAAGNFDTSRVVNIFSLPFASVRIAELNNNLFSTNPEEDNTFAIVQYDTTWSSDLYVPQSYLPSTSAAFANLPADKTGYTGFIPKFLKTQRVYTPTPPTFPTKGVQMTQDGSTSVLPPRMEIRDDKAPSATNPVPPQADPSPPLLAPRPQDYIIPQEDVIKYRKGRLG